MKRYLPYWFLLFCLFMATGVHAQKKNEGFYLYDSAWKSVKTAREAYYFIRVQKMNDTTWRHDYYNMLGPRLATETYKDEAATQPNGRFAWYNALGYIDSLGDVRNGKKHGTWRYFLPAKQTVKPYKEIEYDFGRLVREKQPDTAGYEPGPGDRRPAFDGSFRKFLEKNLQYPDRAQSMALGDVVVLTFVVDNKGNVIDPLVIRSIEFSLDAESEKVINKSSGKWNPGTINGKPVYSFHEQSINFVIPGVTEQ